MVELESFLMKDTEKVILKIDKILSEIPAELAKILNPFSFRFFSFLNLALLDFFNRILAKFLNS
jgi:hypothetical protein